MWDWIISVCFSILLVSMISFILPNGKLSKFINYILSIVLIFVFVKPIFNVDNNFLEQLHNSDFAISYDENYLSFSNQFKAKEGEKAIENMLIKEKIYEPTVEIMFDEGDLVQFKIKKVNIFLSEQVINSNSEHIDIIVRVKTLISEYLSINEGDVNVFKK